MCGLRHESMKKALRSFWAHSRKARIIPGVSVYVILRRLQGFQNLILTIQHFFQQKGFLSVLDALDSFCFRVKICCAVASIGKGVDSVFFHDVLSSLPGVGCLWWCVVVCSLSPSPVGCGALFPAFIYSGGLWWAVPLSNASESKSPRYPAPGAAPVGVGWDFLNFCERFSYFLTVLYRRHTKMSIDRITKKWDNFLVTFPIQILHYSKALMQ